MHSYISWICEIKILILEISDESVQSLANFEISLHVFSVDHIVRVIRKIRLLLEKDINNSHY